MRFLTMRNVLEISYPFMTPCFCTCSLLCFKVHSKIILLMEDFYSLLRTHSICLNLLDSSSKKQSCFPLSTYWIANMFSYTWQILFIDLVLYMSLWLYCNFLKINLSPELSIVSGTTDRQNIYKLNKKI